MKKAKRRVYILSGCTGEYSDRSEWIVGVFYELDDVKAYMKTLEELYLSFPPVNNRSTKSSEIVDTAMKAFDENFMEDYTGTTWVYDQSYVYWTK